ncbi:hypothetical protein Mapa_015415 [Marchantia paleacea]|nr:hypothetical protein Mapa_015415 [Marchantia paleacea]
MGAINSSHSSPWSQTSYKSPTLKYASASLLPHNTGTSEGIEKSPGQRSDPCARECTRSKEPLTCNRDSTCCTRSCPKLHERGMI